MRRHKSPIPAVFLFLIGIRPLLSSAEFRPDISLYIPDGLDCSVERGLWHCRDVFNKCYLPVTDAYGAANVDEMQAEACRALGLAEMKPLIR